MTEKRDEDALELSRLRQENSDLRKSLNGCDIVPQDVRHLQDSIRLLKNVIHTYGDFVANASKLTRDATKEMCCLGVGYDCYCQLQSDFVETTLESLEEQASKLQKHSNSTLSSINKSMKIKLW